ncbi:ubiquitin-related domain-containing protein [Crucibulum laeve]|uniref:Ubiquitin-related domain-containing protein n=1 Tax=Crucibulum laeve TaxID=68775 RepID=A0A5C3LNW0_9AGAR|nr:ubiquitin-related domain-containing protein [Crucibulum laeve]
MTQPTQPPVPQTPQTYLTFLLISGKRRTMSFEPETTIGRVKELVWNGWPIEWQDEHPPAPSYLRVLYLGKMLQDDETLTSESTPPPHGPIPTIVHLSIRPYAPPGEGDAIKKKKGKRAASSTDVSPSTADETHTGGGCCGCVIC